jgi:hypothetical protein
MVTDVIFTGWENHRGAVFFVISGTVASFPVRVKLEMNASNDVINKEGEEKMDWKKSLGMVLLAGMTVVSLAGCNNNKEAAPAATPASPAIEQPAPPTSNSTIPAPPEGMAPGGMPSANGTIPAPPEGMAPGERPPLPTPDLTAAAAKLDVTEEELTEALGDTSSGPVDMAAVAEKLGVTEEALREAPGMPEGGVTPGGPPPTGVEPDTQIQ